MLQIPYLKENRDWAIEQFKKRSIDAADTIDQVLMLDEKRKLTQQELDSQLAEANNLAKQIGDLFKSGNAAEANKLKSKTSSLKESSHILKEQLQQIEDEQKELLYLLPNVPNELVPFGKCDTDNKIVEVHGQPVTFDFDAKPHWDLAKQFDLIDFELGVKIAGAGFPVYKIRT